MNKTLIISALSLALILLISPITVHAKILESINYDITLNTQEDGNIEVEETIFLQSNIDEPLYSLYCWIQNGAKNVVILVNGTEYPYTNDETRYSINISNLKIKIGDQITVEITYVLDKNIQNFEKKLFQKTYSMTVTYDEKILYSGLNLNPDAQLKIPIYKEETQKESPLLYYIIIIILILIIFIFFFISLRLRKKPKIKEITSATEEVLKTNKTLLMSLLKDLEKQYRAKEISDDTYHKIKEHYKQETVETMKKLDDMTKSKI